MLRNEDDDMIIDAVIGLEALLSGGTKGEITYTMSNRIPIIFTALKDDEYNCMNSRSIMKKIYSYRSKIVHGGTIKDKDRLFEINGKQKDLCYIAVDFLRYTIQFMSENPEYLDSSKLDKYIDDILEKNC